MSVTFFELSGDFVELYKVLKFEGLVESGAMAKQVVADGMVNVNGELETRKRRKLVSGDQIAFMDEVIEVR